MKVKELIERLAKEDQDATVYLHTGWEGDPTRVNLTCGTTDGIRKAVVICSNYSGESFEFVDGTIKTKMKARGGK